MAISQGTGSTVYTITPVTTTYCSNPGAYGYPGVVEPIPFITSQAAATTTSTTTAATSPQPLLSASSTITLSTSSSNASLTAELAFLHAELAALLKQAGKQAGTASFSFVFTRNLSLGMTNGDVKQLQTLLAEDSTLYPEDKVTGYFGALTKQAVQRFQSKYGIAKAGQSVYGYVGPATRAKLNSLIKEELAP
jgi:peptidoglycan hydrolase-like protein with peptidoglycan-binding domain